MTGKHASERIAKLLPPTTLTICSRNRPQLLLETVESVLQGEEIPSEIVIVDQSEEPHPQLAAMVPSRECEIRYLHVQSAGVSSARNTSVAAAYHDILALIDDDMFVAPTWFGSLIRALIEAGPRSVVTGQVQAAELDKPGSFAPSTITDQIAAVYEGRVGRDVLYTGNMAMHRDALDEVGLFDERLGAGAQFPAAYDNDFGFRLLEAGYRILYVPQAVVYHRAWRSGSEYVRLYWRYGVGQGAFYAKHLSLRDHYMLSRMRAAIRRSGRRITRSVRKRKPRRAYKELVYLFGLLLGGTKWLVTERIPRKRRIG